MLRRWYMRFPCRRLLPCDGHYLTKRMASGYDVYRWANSRSTFYVLDAPCLTARQKVQIAAPMELPAPAREFGKSLMDTSMESAAGALGPVLRAIHHRDSARDCGAVLMNRNLLAVLERATVHYQPIVDLNIGAIAGFEALMRTIIAATSSIRARVVAESVESAAQAFFCKPPASTMDRAGSGVRRCQRPNCRRYSRPVFRIGGALWLNGSTTLVIPAQAEIQNSTSLLDSRSRGNDEPFLRTAKAPPSDSRARRSRHPAHRRTQCASRD